jgi:flavin-dependent dehydrogenase
MYEAIIVGARCAGSPLAMLLARQGHRVLAVDRDTFPSDTLSTAFMQEEAAERMDRWGLLDDLVAAGTPGVDLVAMHAMGMSFPRPPARYPAYSPRRTVLDKILVDAARAAGAEVREGFSVRALVRDGEGRVIGIEGKDASGAAVTEQAAIVVGADGRNSLVAREVGAEEYAVHEPTTCGYYSYFSGLPMDSADLYLGDRHALFYFPTNDGLVCLAAEAPIENWEMFKADPESYIRDAFAKWAPKAAPLVPQAVRKEKWFGMQGRKSYFRRPYGPGWALAGDAGFLKDPIMGTGIDDAFRDAEYLAEAIDAGLGGGDWDEALGAFHRKRDAAQEGKYELIVEMAKLNFTPQFLAQMATAAGRPPVPS